jgi:hypothetical protein
MERLRGISKMGFDIIERVSAIWEIKWVSLIWETLL